HPVGPHPTNIGTPTDSPGGPSVVSLRDVEPAASRAGLQPACGGYLHWRASCKSNRMSRIAGNCQIRAKTTVPRRVSTPRKTRQTRQIGGKLLITLSNLLSGLVSEGQKPDMETRQTGWRRPIILRPRCPHLGHPVRPEEEHRDECGGHPCWSPRSVFGLLEFPDSGQWTPADSSRAVVSAAFAH